MQWHVKGRWTLDKVGGSGIWITERQPREDGGPAQPNFMPTQRAHQFHFFSYYYYFLFLLQYCDILSTIGMDNMYNINTFKILEIS